MALTPITNQTSAFEYNNGNATVTATAASAQVINIMAAASFAKTVSQTPQPTDHYPLNTAMTFTYTFTPSSDTDSVTWGALTITDSTLTTVGFTINSTTASISTATPTTVTATTSGNTITVAGDQLTELNSSTTLTIEVSVTPSQYQPATVLQTVPTMSLAIATTGYDAVTPTAPAVEVALPIGVQTVNTLTVAKTLTSTNTYVSQNNTVVYTITITPTAGASGPATILASEEIDVVPTGLTVTALGGTNGGLFTKTGNTITATSDISIAATGPAISFTITATVD